MNLKSLSTLAYAAAMVLLLGELLPMDRTSGLIAPAAAQSADQSLVRTAPIQLPSSVVPEHYDIFVRPDAENLRFDASVRITVSVRQPTSDIVLNAADLQVERAVLMPGAEQAANIELNHEQQTATLTFPRTIEPGTYELAIDYKGRISENADGLFVARYGTPEAPKRMLVTQFEPVSARRFVPCWDEPARKATFSLSVAVPKDEVAVSNMPVEEISELDGNRQRVRFQRSPKMSSYLLFLGIGDLERLETTVGPTKLAVVARKGSAYKGQFALDSAAQLLGYFNEYFGVPYPLPKLDMIAVPGGGGFAAMENWGAILYFENALLVDPDLSPESARQYVFVVIAHEMAHQWFGNLVTMQWWDDLWLNEGFASWMENKATDRFHPEWTMWLQSEAARQRAMRQDAKRTTHPVVQPVIRGDQATQAFDEITYRKGQAVIRMLEGYLGQEAFRQGIRTYMQRYAYQNTVTDDLWAELEKAAQQPIKPIADDFTLQPGVPLIAVEEVRTQGTQTTVDLKQERFGVDNSARDSLVWRTPVSAGSIGSGTLPVSQLIAGPSPTSISVPGTPPIKINLGQTAYYRSYYAKGAFLALADRFPVLPPADQLGLLYDSWALGEAGVTPLTNYLELIQKAPLGSESTVWRQIIETLMSIDRLYAGQPEQMGFRTFARATLTPLFEQVGWNARSGEPDNTAVLREDLLNALGQFGEPSVVAEARRRFNAFLADPKSLPAAIRVPTLRVVAISADAALYETMHELARKAADPLEKDQLFAALAWAEDPVLASRTLELALSNEPSRATGLRMITRVASSHPDLAWQFATGHLDALSSRLDRLQRYSFVPSLGAQATSLARLEELRRFIDDKVPAEFRPQAERYYADLEFRLKVKAERLPQITQWLATRSTSPRAAPVPRP
jgi:aminopeptidase N